MAHGVGYPDWSHRSYAAVVDDEALDLFLFAADTPAALLDAYTQLTGRAPDVPLWSLGLWVSRADYRTPEEAVDVAATLRERRIPCDVITLDGGAAWKVETRFNFRWDPDGLFDVRESLAALKAHDFRVCVGECPYVSVHDPLFAELAGRGFLLRSATATRWCSAGNRRPGTSPFGNAPTPLPPSGIVDFTHPDAFAWWRDAHQALFADGVDVIKSDFGEQVPDDAVAFNGDRGSRLHNVYPLLYNQCVFGATAKFQKPADAPPMVWSRAAWSSQQRFPMGWGGDSAERLRGPGRVDPRRPVVGHERQPVPQLGHRRLLRRRPAVAGTLPALAAGDGVLRRTSACTAPARASPGRSGRRPRRSPANGWRSATG